MAHLGDLVTAEITRRGHKYKTEERKRASRFYLHEIAMLVGVEVPVRSPEALALYSQCPQRHL